MSTEETKAHIKIGFTTGGPRNKKPEKQQKQQNWFMTGWPKMILGLSFWAFSAVRKHVKTNDVTWRAHYGTKPGYLETSNHSLSHVLGSE